MNHIKNLVFEGGGVKGIAYVGALKALKNHGILQNCQRFAGNSAGSISAWLATYYRDDIAEMERIQRETNFSDFKDDSIGVVRDAYRLLDRYGWHKGDAFYRWACDITKRRFGKRNITFSELFAETGFELVVTSCNVSKAKTVWFSKDTTPNFYVEKALRMSMSIPVFFRGIFIDDEDIHPDGHVIGNPDIGNDCDDNRDLFVDGGVLDNYPIQAFDNEKTQQYPLSDEVIVTLDNRKNPIYNKSTLGLRVDSESEIRQSSGQNKDNKDVYESENFFNYLLNMVDLLHSKANQRHLDDFDWHRTIRINTGDVKATDFDLGVDVQNELISVGKDGVEKYLNQDRSQFKNNP